MNVRRRLWYSLRHRNVDADLAEELESRAMALARLEDNAARIEPVKCIAARIARRLAMIANLSDIESICP